MEKQYQKIMKLAIKLAKKSEPFPNPKVGAVLVNNNQVIGLGYHKKAGMDHAEIEAIKDAKSRGNESLINGSTIFVSLEPCSHKNKRTPPCTVSIVNEGITNVVFGMKDPNPNVDSLNYLNKNGVAVIGPIAQKECELINKKYISNLRKRPTVVLKMAASIDGKTATRTGDSKWISSEKSRIFVHKMRANCDAIIVGAATIANDNPQLTPYLVKSAKTPYRIIIDGKLSIPTSAKVMKNPDHKTMIFTSQKADQKKKDIVLKNKNVRLIECGTEEGRVDLPRMIQTISNMGMKKILVEGGSELAGALMDQNLVDELCLFIAPIIIGGRDSKPIIGANGIERIVDARKIENLKIKKIGKDLLLTGKIKKKK